MSPEGWAETARRLLSLMLVSAGLATFGRLTIWAGIGLIAAALIVYAFFPAPPVEKEAMRYDRGPAVIGPDLLGLVMTGLFLALPVWIAHGEGTYGEEAPILHGTAWLVWPMALLSALILAVGGQHASFRLVVEDDGIRLTTARSRRSIPYDSIASVSPWRRGLPKFIKGLVPVLLMMGKPGPAGAVMLARDSTGVELKLTDGTSIRISADAFEKNTSRLLKVLKEKGIGFEAGLSKWLR